MTRGSLPGSVAALVVLAAGCPEPEPGLQVGTGDAAFVPLSDGDSIAIIQGPQGGFHLLGALQATGVEPGDTSNIFDAKNPTMHFQVHDGDDRVDASNPFTQGLDDSDERGVYEVVGRFIFLDIESDDELAGHTLTLSVSIQDVDGVALFDSVAVLAEPSPFNE